MTNKSALDFATEDCRKPLRETNGPNRSPEIDAINTFVGNELGDPYCAAGVCWCFHEAGASGFPKTGSAKAIRDHFIASGHLSLNPNAMLHWKGALFGWTNEDGHGHIGFVRGRLTNAEGEVVAIETAEYNTSAAGSRDGEGAYWLTRLVNSPHCLWFLDTSGIPGGAGWE